MRPGHAPEHGQACEDSGHPKTTKPRRPQNERPGFETKTLHKQMICSFCLGGQRYSGVGTSQKLIGIQSENEILGVVPDNLLTIFRHFLTGFRRKPGNICFKPSSLFFVFSLDGRKSLISGTSGGPGVPSPTFRSLPTAPCTQRVPVNELDRLVGLQGILRKICRPVFGIDRLSPPRKWPSRRGSNLAICRRRTLRLPKIGLPFGEYL